MEQEHIYTPTSRKEGGETPTSLDAYFKAFPLTPESGSIDYKNYLHAERAVLDTKSSIYEAMAWIKGGVTYVDAVAKKQREYPEFPATEEQANQLHSEVMKKIRTKMEELKYLLDFVDFPEQSDELYDIAGGAGDTAIALMLQAHIERRNLRKATIVDPISEFQTYADLIMNHMPFGAELKKRVSFQEQTLQDIMIPSQAIVVAKHPCGDLADDLLERWLQSESPELVVMTCCQGKAKNRPPRYDLTPEEWKTLCVRSDWTNSENPQKRSRGMDAMVELDMRRVEFLRHEGIHTDLHSTDRFFKGNVIVAKRYHET
jgi:hypothetical protein